MTTKKSTKRIALLTALVLVTACFIGGTIARYVTSTSSEDEARVAIWGINGGTIQMELFDSSYDANGTKIAESSDGDKIIAPGTSMSSAFSIMDVNSTIAPEVMYEVGINLDDSEIAPEILANPSVQWRLDDNAWGTWAECKEDILNLTGSTGGKKVYAPNTLPDSFSDGQEHTIAWQWVMDNGTDEEDTAMGNAAVNGDLKANISIAVTARQVDVDSTGMIEGQDSVYDPSNPEPLVFRSVAPFNEFQSVKVGSTTLTEGTHYTVEDGSTIVTLKESYLETLKAGRYVISIVSDSMTAKASFEIKENASLSNSGIIHNGKIPTGGIYYSGLQSIYDEDKEINKYYLKDYSSATKTYTAGQPFPEPQLGDVYVYDNYEYRYNVEMDFEWDYSSTWYENLNLDGWGVVYIGKETAPGEILTTINGKDVVSMSGTFINNSTIVTPPTIPTTVKNMLSTFDNCTALESAPIIPENVTNLCETFSYCINLTGEIEINAQNVYVGSIFDETTKPITIKGSCPKLEEIAIGYNNVTIYLPDTISPLPDTWDINPLTIAEATEQGFDFYLEGDTYSLGTFDYELGYSQHKGNQTELMLPSSIDGKKVTSITMEHFCDKSGIIKKMIVPSTYNNFPYGALGYFNNIDILILNENAQLDNNVFYDATKVRLFFDGDISNIDTTNGNIKIYPTNKFPW